MLKIKKIVVGEWGVNCYLLVSNNELTVVDPGDEADKIIAEIEKTVNLDNISLSFLFSKSLNPLTENFRQ